MKTKYIATGLCCFAFVLMWNAFVIQRDKKMFDAYYGHQTTKEHSVTK